MQMLWVRRMVVGAVILAPLYFGNVYAGWVGPASVKVINIGGNATHATYVQLNGVSFSGCSSTNTAVVKSENVNYQDILAALLAAKFAQASIKMLTASCDGAYSIVSEIVVE